MNKLSRNNSAIIILFYVLVMIAIAWYADIPKVIDAISKLSVVVFLEVVILLTLAIYVSAENIRILWAGVSTIPFRRFFRQFLKSWVISHFTPSRVGDYTLSFFLSDSKSIGRISALITLDKLISIVLSVGIALFLSLTWFHVLDISSVLVVMAIALAGVAFLFWKKTRDILKKILGARSVIFEGFSKELFHIIWREPWRIGVNAFFTVIRVGIQSLIFYVVLHAVGVTATPEQAIFIAIIGQIAAILAFTPNAIGIREPLIVVTASQIGIANAPMVATIFILHGIEWAYVLTVTLLLGASTFSTKPTEKISHELTALYLSCGVITHQTQPMHPTLEVFEHHGETIIGVCGIVKRYAFLPTLYLAVDARHQGKGIGKQLVEKLLKKYRGIIFLTVSPENVPAEKIYQRLGFKKLFNWRHIRGYPTYVMVKLNF